MPGKTPALKYVVNMPFDRTDKPGENVEWRPPMPWPADHPDTDKYLEWQLIVPAPAGSSQPGKTDEGAE